MPIHRNLVGHRMPTDVSGELRNYVVSEQLGASETMVHENVLIPGAVVQLHKHAVEEIIICTEGEGEVVLGDAPPARYRSGDVIIIPKDVWHTLCNVGHDTMRQLCFFPALTSRATWKEADTYGGDYLGGDESKDRRIVQTRGS